MDDGRHSALRADLAAAIRQLFDIRLDLASWANGEAASLERIEPMMKDIDRAVRELGSVMSLLLQVEHLPDVRPVGVKSPSLDAIARHARHVDPVIPDGIHLRLQQVVSTARTALVGAKASQGPPPIAH